MGLGKSLMVVLLFQYVIIAAVFAGSKDWPRAIYWTGAAIITVAVLLMK